MSAKKNVFVTVGTTRFDKLIKTASGNEVGEILKKHGYTHLVMQTGCGEDVPSEDNPHLSSSSFTFKESIAEDIIQADLVISHAGAGTCLDVLQENKPLVVVINDDLMNNHQLELAEKLYKEGHVFYSTCKDLPKVLRDLDISKLVPFEKGQTKSFSTFLDMVMGLT